MNKLKFHHDEGDTCTTTTRRFKRRLVTTGDADENGNYVVFRYTTYADMDAVEVEKFPTYTEAVRFMEKAN